LLREATGLAAKTLKQCSVDLKDARVQCEQITGRGSGFVGIEIPYTPRAKRVLVAALDEARLLDQEQVATEHLLLGILREGEGVAVRMLENLGLDPQRLRTLVLENIRRRDSAAEQVAEISLQTRASLFERIVEKDITVFMLAQEEARRLGHNFVGTEQLLLGLIGEGSGLGAKTLESFGVNLRDARVEVEKIIGRGSGFVAIEIPFTPRAKRVLELSWDEARQLGHNFIGSEHLLLGLIREGEGVAARVLENLGVNLHDIRPQVMKMLAEQGPDLVGNTPKALSSRGFTCPSCDVQIPKEAITCRFCGYGISDEHYIECKFCKQRIRKGAIKCRYCFNFLNED